MGEESSPECLSHSIMGASRAGRERVCPGSGHQTASEGGNEDAMNKLSDLFRDQNDQSSQDNKLQK